MFVKLSLILGIIIGALTGVSISFITNCTLIEISKRRFFAYVSKMNKLSTFPVFSFLLGLSFSLDH